MSDNYIKLCQDKRVQERFAKDKKVCRPPKGNGRPCIIEFNMNNDVCPTCPFRWYLLTLDDLWEWVVEIRLKEVEYWKDVLKEFATWCNNTLEPLPFKTIHEALLTYILEKAE